MIEIEFWLRFYRLMGIYLRNWLRHISIPLCILLLLGSCTYTRPFTDASGRAIPGSIAQMEVLQIGGVNQSVWFRGRDTAAPALILLHGGPGASEAALFRHYNAALEDYFLVVYWEQRGAGRSYHGNIARESMTIEQIEQDLDELVDLVRNRFEKERVILLGHSWGTILGTRYAHVHPEKVAAYVGIAQIADFAEGEQISLQWALAQAKAHDNQRALNALQSIAPVPLSVSQELELGRWVEHFGGSLRAGLNTGKLIWAALRTDEANLVDLWKFGAGNQFSLNALRPQYSQVNLTTIRRFQVPIVFMLGRHDWHVPAVLASTYFQAINAPCKQLIWFENSAHNPPFEEPDTFIRTMVEEVLPLIHTCSPALE